MGFSDSSPLEKSETFVPQNVLNSARQRVYCFRNVLYCVKEPVAENGLMGIPREQNWVTYNFSTLVDFCYLKPFAASSQVPEEWRTEIQQVVWLALSNRCRSMPNVLSHHPVCLHSLPTPGPCLFLRHTQHTCTHHPHLFACTALLEGAYIGKVRKNTSLLCSAIAPHKAGPREETSHAFYLITALTMYPIQIYLQVVTDRNLT